MNTRKRFLSRSLGDGPETVRFKIVNDAVVATLAGVKVDFDRIEFIWVFDRIIDARLLTVRIFYADGDRATINCGRQPCEIDYSAHVPGGVMRDVKLICGGSPLQG